MCWVTLLRIECKLNHFENSSQVWWQEGLSSDIRHNFIDSIFLWRLDMKILIRKCPKRHIAINFRRLNWFGWTYCTVLPNLFEGKFWGVKFSNIVSHNFLLFHDSVKYVKNHNSCCYFKKAENLEKVGAPVIASKRKQSWC